MLLAEGMFKESMGLAQHDVLEECNHIAMRIYIYINVHIFIFIYFLVYLFIYLFIIYMVSRHNEKTRYM